MTSKMLRKKAIKAMRINEVVSSFKNGMVGMSFAIIITKNTDASILAVVPILSYVGCMAHNWLIEKCTDNLKIVHRLAYPLAYVSDVALISLMFYFMITKQYTLMVTVEAAFVLEGLMYAPMFAMYQYVRMTAFGGHHRGKFYTKYTSRTSVVKSFLQVIASCINLGIFWILPEQEAIVLTMYLFLSLFCIDLFANMYESSYVDALYKDCRKDN